MKKAKSHAELIKQLEIKLERYKKMGFIPSIDLPLVGGITNRDISELDAFWANRVLCYKSVSNG